MQTVAIHNRWLTTESKGGNICNLRGSGLTWLQVPRRAGAFWDAPLPPLPLLLLDAASEESDQLAVDATGRTETHRMHHLA